MTSPLSERQTKRAAKLALDLEAQSALLHSFSQKLILDAAKALEDSIFNLADEIASASAELDQIADTVSRTIHDEDLV